jgi:hypothetical protein
MKKQTPPSLSPCSPAKRVVKEEESTTEKLGAETLMEKSVIGDQ